MMRDFKQIYVSDTLSFFKKTFIDRWKLEEYSNPTLPAVFMGCYSPYDLNIIQNHKAPFIMVWGGADQNKFDLIKSLPFLVGSPAYRPIMIDTFNKINYPYKRMVLPFKNYEEFTPTPLGKNIYVYKGFNGDRPGYYGWEEVIKPLQQIFGVDRIIYAESKPLQELKENYYNNCFVYVKPNDKGGNTSMWELGYMGRKTVGFNHGNLPNVLNSTSLEDMIQHIEKESNKIGTIQHEVANQTHEALTHSDEWLTLNFWK